MEKFPTLCVKPIWQQGTPYSWQEKRGIYLEVTKKIIVSLTPSSFDEEIKQISYEEFTYHFGIKMNENGLWDDS